MSQIGVPRRGGLFCLTMNGLGGRDLLHPVIGSTLKLEGRKRETGRMNKKADNHQNKNGLLQELRCEV